MDLNLPPQTLCKVLRFKEITEVPIQSSTISQLSRFQYHQIPVTHTKTVILGTLIFLFLISPRIPTNSLDSFIPFRKEIKLRDQLNEH